MARKRKAPTRAQKFLLREQLEIVQFAVWHLLEEHLKNTPLDATGIISGRGTRAQDGFYVEFKEEESYANKLLLRETYHTEVDQSGMKLAECLKELGVDLDRFYSAIIQEDSSDAVKRFAALLGDEKYALLGSLDADSELREVSQERLKSTDS